MQKVSGPTIPRWKLGEELARLRTEAGLTWKQVAKHLGCSESKVQKIEGGNTSVVRAEFQMLLDLYEVKDDALRQELWDLQTLGKQRGWWAPYGTVTKSFARYLALESSATMVKIFQPLVVHGLLQTPAYSREIERGAALASEEDQERAVQIRLARQEKIWGSGHPPHVWVILDESVLHRVMGDAAVMREQLEHLLAMRHRYTLQVVPFRAGGYPGALGPFTIFEFEENAHSPVLYVDNQGGSLYVEKSDELARCNLVYMDLTAAALSPAESVQLVEHIAQGYSPG